MVPCQNAAMDHGREITNLVFTYAERIDAGDFAGVGALFARGRIVLDPANRDADVAGAARVERLYAATTRRYPDGTPRTHHVTTNVRVDVDPGERTATASSYFTVLQAIPEGGLALGPIVTGTYHDRFVRPDDAWWFDERRITLRHVGDVSHHLLIPLAPASSAAPSP